MLGGVSLTCARGVDADEFLLALGADPEELAGRTPCEDLLVPARRRGGRSPHMNRAMYGTCGDWVYVLEGWGMATWATGYRAVESMRARTGRGDRLRDDERVEPAAEDHPCAG